ncbi:DUF3888 domain-containing protein [Mesobacillus foraminis]|uniref:DUF3888 domain-containing protein n=1 Tax=Mesobacillus foraminis TaxID=279826 RepID=UPI0039A2FF8C
MKKKLISTIIPAFLFFSSPFYSTATDLPEELLEKELIHLLRGPILSVVGVDWFRGNEKILAIKQDEQDRRSLNVKVQVVTFQGPHNPPYLQEVVTFNIKDNSIKPIDYFNRIIPESEWNDFNIP